MSFVPSTAVKTNFAGTELPGKKFSNEETGPFSSTYNQIAAAPRMTKNMGKRKAP